MASNVANIFRRCMGHAPFLLLLPAAFAHIFVLSHQRMDHSMS